MAWIEISVRVRRDDAALVELTLDQHGALSVTLEDDEDHPVLEPAPGETPLWPAVRVRGLFPEDADRRRVVGAVLASGRVSRPDECQWSLVEDRDWTRAWMDRFEPMKFGEKLWIVPGGMDIRPDPDAIEIRLDPGLAFGTGTHPTTALCLEWIDGLELASSTFVDYGCGSGVLGIAAALKGAGRVVSVDNDPQALEATADNAKRNGVEAVLERHAPESCPPVSADFVVANILAGPLIELAPVLLGLLRERGRLALSGILSGQVEPIFAAYRHGLGEMLVRDRDEWVLIRGRKRGGAEGAAL